MAIFDETYRVVGVETQRLTIQGILSGEIMTIVNTAPGCPLTPEDYPLGQLIALTDPSTAASQLTTGEDREWKNFLMRN